MATIFALPTAAPAPVVQLPRRGRLPRAVTSLTAVRRERQKKRDALLATYMKKSEAVCFAVLRRIMDGETTGVAIVEACSDGTGTISVGGEFVDKMDWLQSSLDHSSDACAMELLAKRKT